MKFQHTIIIQIIIYTYKVQWDSDWLIDWFLVFNATFSYIMATSFSGGRSRREPPTMSKQLVNFYHLRLRVQCTFFCNLQSQARTHAVLVIGLYELLGNPTT
jgi:hypothetical protein